MVELSEVGGEGVVELSEVGGEGVGGGKEAPTAPWPSTSNTFLLPSPTPPPSAEQALSGGM